MNTIHEPILNQEGEVTDVVAPSDFGAGLSFFNPTDMPDLDAAEKGINIQPESIEFTKEGESLRAVFNGFTTLQVKDKVNVGSYVDRRAAVLQTKTGIKINMGANLLKQLDLIPVGTAVQITYKGEQKTNSGNKVKTYDVHLLNVPRVNIPAIVSKPQLPTRNEPQQEEAQDIELFDPHSERAVKVADSIWNIGIPAAAQEMWRLFPKGSAPMTEQEIKEAILQSA